MFRVLAIAALTFSLAADAAAAQSLRRARPPAELPPASYNGTQYVDSQGCAYVRSGAQGTVIWVPRVTRKRQHICGQAPSLRTRTAPAAAVQPVAAAQAAPAQARAFRAAAPAAARVPEGYRAVWEDGRLNPQRGVAAGAAGASAPPRAGRYVIAGRFASRTAAQEAAQALSVTGLPVRLGQFGWDAGKPNVLLAGPFAAPEEARGALAAVRRAGYPGAKLSR